MLFSLYDYVDGNGKNAFRSWTVDLQKKQRAKLNEKLDKLAQYGDELYPLLLAGTTEAGIQKLKIKGNVQLRPLLCKGPVDQEHEYTLLMGAKEVGGEWSPINAPTKAFAIRAVVRVNPQTRRKPHERVA